MEDSRLEETSLKNVRFEKTAVKVIVIDIEVDKLEKTYRRTAGSKIFSEYLYCFSNTSSIIIKIPPLKIEIM